MEEVIEKVVLPKSSSRGKIVSNYHLKHVIVQFKTCCFMKNNFSKNCRP